MSERIGEPVFEPRISRMRRMLLNLNRQPMFPRCVSKTIQLVNMKTKHLPIALLACGLVTCNTALAQPVITNQPQNQTNIAGTTAMFTVGATGALPLSYRWRSHANATVFTNIPWGTEATLLLTNVQLTTRRFGVVVSDAVGSVTSVLATLTVFGITTQPTNFPSVSIGASVSNRVVVSSAVPLNYQWRRDGNNLFAQTNATVVLTNVQLADSGEYTVVVTIVAGSVTSQVARLTVDPTFTKITAGNIVTDIATSSGCSWGDYDDDGFVDLFVANTTLFGAAPNRGRNFLYHNNHDGTFLAITSGPIVTEIADHVTGVWGDFDNDGFLDLFVTSIGQINSLFRNLDNNTFARTNAGSLVTTASDYDGAAWGDYDNDGFLDLFITQSGGAQSNPLANFLYRNNGNGIFTKITNGNVATDLGIGRGCAWGDFDNDGNLDLFVSNAFFITNFLYRNRGDLMFTRVTAGSIATEVADSRGCAWADYDNDGYLDLFVANGGRTSAQNNFLYHNNGDGNLTKVTSGSIVNDGGHSFGCTWGDYDNDGFLDLFVANGCGQNNLLYHNNGDGSFTKVTTGSPVNDGGESGGCAWGDYDNDGFLDLFVANGGNTCSGNDENQRNFLYRNNTNRNNWISIKLVGTVSNRSGIGAKVRLKATVGGTNRWQLRQISGGDGYGQMNGLRAHFGLGDATNIDTVRIEWPSGTVQELRDVWTNQFLTVTESPRLQAARLLPDGSFQFQLVGRLGFHYAIETSSNLTVWTLWQTVTATNRTTRIEDPATQPPQRFYRALSVN